MSVSGIAKRNKYEIKFLNISIFNYLLFFLKEDKLK